jgi:RNA polymerase sigma factor (sigma-70 family)
LAGNREAYGELVAKYQSMVYRVCLKITHDEHAAEDLAQEVFIKAYHALPGFRQDASFSTWLYQIAVRKCLDWRRSFERERQRRGEAPYDEYEWPDPDSPERRLVEKERTLRLRELVDGLHEPYRTVTTLFYFHQQSYQEIAERTGTSVKTVESQLYRARRMLREKGDGLR